MYPNLGSGARWSQAVALTAVACILSVPTARAQCADGSVAGNCRPVRRDPPLDDRTWIVLPFANITRASDIEWLSAAAVNLLYVDMSRWTDLRVVDDGRVTDLLRNVPEARRGQLGLDSAIAIAKRAGAGRLVTGEYLKLGTRITLTAKVYNTRTRERVRTPMDTIADMDAMGKAFSRLAAKVLAVPPPRGTTLGGPTQSAEAMQAYLLGRKAHRRWDTDSALSYYRKAIRIDSAFALAHWQLAGLSGLYRLTAERARARTNAARFAATLPERERVVVAQGLSACDKGSRLLALDSSDATGWVQTGNCLANDPRVRPDAAGRMVAVVSSAAADRAYRRAFSLQSEDRDAVQALFHLYSPDLRFGCVTTASTLSACPTDSLYVGAALWENDSLVQRFVPLQSAVAESPLVTKTVQAGLRARLEQVRALAAQWTSANPEILIDHTWYALFLLRLGDVDGAARELAASADLSRGGDKRNLAVDRGLRIAVELRREHPERARPMLDSLLYFTPQQSIAPPYQSAFGAFSRDYAPADSAARRSVRTQFNTGFAGVVSAGYAGVIRSYAELVAAQTPVLQRESARRAVVELGTMLAFHGVRARPLSDTASLAALVRYQAWFAQGDTVRARRALNDYDAWGATRADDAFDSYELFAAESHLELGDSAVAWQRIKAYGTHWREYCMMDGGSRCSDFLVPTTTDALPSSIRLIGRAWLLYADLALANGQRDEARRGYRMVVGLWEHGEAPVQPLYARARKALADLGG